MSAQSVIGEITNLPWQRLSPAGLQQLMVLSHHAAREFAASLRVAKRLYPNNKELYEMATGELETTNLHFDSYKGPGDHADYLDHFIRKCNVPTQVHAKGTAYERLVAQLPDTVRASSVFEREQYLPEIFKRILAAPDWDAPGLEAYRHYLEKHIQFDTEPGGHAEKVANLSTTAAFWNERRHMYRSLGPFSEEFK